MVFRPTAELREMKYRKYEATIDIADELGMFHRVVIIIRDVITFYGKSVAEFNREFENSVEDHLEFCEREMRSQIRRSSNFLRPCNL